MVVEKGTTDINAIYFGTTQIQYVYLGTTEVYPNLVLVWEYQYTTSDEGSVDACLYDEVFSSDPLEWENNADPPGVDGCGLGDLALVEDTYTGNSFFVFEAVEA